MAEYSELQIRQAPFVSVKLRFFVALIIFSFLSFLFGLSVFRHINFGGPALKGYKIQIINLSEILPNIYHLIINQSSVEGLFVTNKNTFKRRLELCTHQKSCCKFQSKRLAKSSEMDV